MTRKNEICNIRDSYQFYKEKVERDNESYIADEDTYIDIIKLFFKFLFKLVLEGEEVSLPMRMGTVSIKGKVGAVTNAMVPNWPATKELRERCEECNENKQIVYHLNEHTDYTRYSFRWNNKNYPIPNKSFYRFILSKNNKTEIYKKIMAGKEYVLE